MPHHTTVKYKPISASRLLIVFPLLLLFLLIGGCDLSSKSRVPVLSQSPQNISTTNGADSVTINWSALSAASRYNVYRCPVNTITRQCDTATEEACGVAIGTTSGNQFTDTGIGEGEVGCYAIQACNKRACTGLSSAALGHWLVGSPISIGVSGTQVAVAGQQVTLHSRVINNDGNPRYSWAQTSGTTVTLSNSTGADLSFTAPNVPSAETLVFTLTVTDNQGSSTSEHSVTINPDSVFAKAGSDQFVYAGQAVSLHGSGLGGGGSAGYAWSQVDGVPVTLDNSLISNPSFTAPTVQISTDLRFELSFNDGTAIAKDRVTIHVMPVPSQAHGSVPFTTVGNQVPAPLLVTAAPTAHTVDETNLQLSAFAQGGVGSYTWSWQLTGKSPNTEPDVTFSNGSETNQVALLALPAVTTQTTYTLTVTATDIKGDMASATTTLEVYPNAVPALLPLSVTAPSFIADEGPQPASLSAIGSGGTPPYQYAWTQTGGSPTVTLIDADTHISYFDTPAINADTELTFNVEVTDATAQTANETVKVLIRDSFALTPRQKLVVQTLPPMPAISGSTIQLAANAHGGDNNYTWNWTQSSGSTATITGANTNAPTIALPSVAKAEILKFAVSVDDNSGQSANGRVIVNLQAVGQLNPLTTSASPRVNVPENQLDFPLSISVQGGSGSYSYAWQQVLGDPIALTSADQAIAYIDTPMVNSNTNVRFNVVVTDTATNEHVEQQLSVTIQDILQPDKALAVQTGGTIRVLSGNTVDLTATATGGSGNYNYTWTQTRGPSAQLTGTDQATLSVDTPISAAQEQLVFSITVTDSGMQTATNTVTIAMHPDISQLPLSISAVPTLYVDEGQTDIALIGLAFGGTGNYQYQWSEYKKQLTIPLQNADSAVARFDAPAVDHTFPIRFELTVTDGVSTVSYEQSVVINDLAASLQLHALSDQQVTSGDQVHLNGAPAQGGLSPYTYSWAQPTGPAVTLSNGNTPNPGFTAPHVANATTLQFQYTTEDSIGNSTTVEETVVVEPIIPTLAVHLNGPSSVNSQAQVHLNAQVAGGTPPYTYHYQATGAPLSIPASANPSVQMPKDNSMYKLTVEIQLVVSDSNGITGTDKHTITVESEPHQALLCGDLPSQRPCTDLDLVLAQTDLCPPDKPFAMNDIIKIGDRVLEFRRCVNRQTCQVLWFQDTSNIPECLPFDPSQSGDLTCHLCCYGEGCNTLTNPPDNTMYRP